MPKDFTFSTVVSKMHRVLRRWWLQQPRADWVAGAACGRGKTHHRRDAEIVSNEALLCGSVFFLLY